MEKLNFIIQKLNEYHQSIQNSDIKAKDRQYFKGVDVNYDNFISMLPKIPQDIQLLQTVFIESIYYDYSTLYQFCKNNKKGRKSIQWGKSLFIIIEDITSIARSNLDKDPKNVNKVFQNLVSEKENSRLSIDDGILAEIDGLVKNTTTKYENMKNAEIFKNEITKTDEKIIGALRIIKKDEGIQSYSDKDINSINQEYNEPESINAALSDLVFLSDFIKQ